MIELNQRIPIKYSVNSDLALECFKLYFEQRWRYDICETRLLGREKL